MHVKMLYVTQPGEQPRDLIELELDQVPYAGENVTYADRVYKTIERSFVIHRSDQNKPYMTCAMLVGQIGGPPHLIPGTPALVVGRAG